MKELDPSIVAFLRSKKRLESRKPAQDPEPMKVDDDADGRQSDDHQDVQPVRHISASPPYAWCWSRWKKTHFWTRSYLKNQRKLYFARI